MNIQSILVSILCGGLFSGAWFCLIDGIVQSHMNGGGGAPPPFMWFYALPAFFVTLTNILMNVVDKKQLYSSNSVFSDSSGNKKATAWFIFMLAGSMCCIGGKGAPWRAFSIFNIIFSPLLTRSHVD